MSGSDTGISLFVPFYNEADIAASVVADCRAALEATGRDYELLLVDDGSTDGTAAILDDIGEEHTDTRAIHHDTNQGYGQALITGFEAAEHHVIGYIDGDGQFDPSDLSALLAASDQYDIVAGYREPRRDDRMRRVIGAGFNHLARAMLPIDVRDIDCGFKLVQSDVIDSINLRMQRTVDAELLAKAAAAGFDIGEVAVTHRAREVGRSEAAGVLGVRISLIVKTVEELSMIRDDIG